MSEFYNEVYQLQAAHHRRQAAEAKRDLEVAEADGDTMAGAQAAARLLEVNNSWASFDAGARAHAASMIPAPEKRDAWQTKDLSEMTNRDVFQMVNQTSKYTDRRAGGEPVSAEEFNRHAAERDRRLAIGFYGQDSR